MPKRVKTPPSKIVLDDGQEYNQETIDLSEFALDDILAEFDEIDEFGHDYDLPEYRQAHYVPEILETPECFPFAQNARILLKCCQNRQCGKMPCDGTCKRKKHRFSGKYKPE